MRTVPKALRTDWSKVIKGREETTTTDKKHVFRVVRETRGMSYNAHAVIKRADVLCPFCDVWNVGLNKAKWASNGHRCVNCNSLIGTLTASAIVDEEWLKTNYGE